MNSSGRALLIIEAAKKNNERIQVTIEGSPADTIKRIFPEIYETEKK